jgi:hypothetical protein
LIVGAHGEPTRSDHPEGKSYVVSGKKDNTNAVNLSSVASGSGGFVINGLIKSKAFSPLITKPPVPDSMVDKSTAPVSSFFPNTTLMARQMQVNLSLCLARPIQMSLSYQV